MGESCVTHGTVSPPFWPRKSASEGPRSGLLLQLTVVCSWRSQEMYKEVTAKWMDSLSPESREGHETATESLCWVWSRQLLAVALGSPLDLFLVVGTL